MTYPSRKAACHLRNFAIFLIAGAAGIHWANGQNNPKSTSNASCPDGRQFTAAQLHGTWTASFSPTPSGLPSTATVELTRHEEFADSLAGTVARAMKNPTKAGTGHAAKAWLAGDLEEGFLLLDESSNNTSISGTWNGELVPSSCGREIRGVWQDTSAEADQLPADQRSVTFVLTKRAGW